MSAPFPNPEAQRIAFMGSVPQMTERGSYIPRCYVPHEDPSVTVKSDGVDLLPRFCVGDIPPERRWAIGPTGEVMGQLRFEAQYQRNIEDFYEIEKMRTGNPSVRLEGKVERCPIPNAIAYVSVQVDTGNPKNVVPVGYDPSETAGAKPETLATSDGEHEAPRMPVLIAQYREDPSRLRADERAEVEAILGKSAAAPATADGVVSLLTELNALRAAGTIDDESYRVQVAAITGAPMPEPKRTYQDAPTTRSTKASTRKKTAEGTVPVPCGGKIKDPKRVRNHVLLCGKAACAEERDRLGIPHPKRRTAQRDVPAFVPEPEGDAA